MNDEEKLAALERENQSLRGRLASLDELPREKKFGTVSDLKGVQDMTTSVSKGIRSMPGTQDRYYLDLYLLQKERERLAKETTWIKRRRLRVGRRVADIGKEMVEKEEKAVKNMAIFSPETAVGKANRPAVAGDEKRAQRKHEPKEFKTMIFDY